MIVAMKKLTALIFYKDYHEFLERLRDLGVVHIFTKKNIHLDNDDLLTSMNLLKSYKETIKFVNKYSCDPIEAELSEDGEFLYNNIQTYRRQFEVIESRLAALNKDRSSLEPWGDFSKEMIQKLALAGARIDFFLCLSSKFKNEWIDEYNAIQIDDVGGQIYFVTVSYDGNRPEIDAEPFEIPEFSLTDLSQKEDDLIKEKDLILNYFQKASLSVDALENAKNSVQQKLEFETICESSVYAVDDKLIVLEAWLPVDTEEDVQSWLDDKDVYFTIDKPTIEDNVPIKLKNNRFAKLFEFIGELYSMPKYGEIDLTPFFAPFFVLFFGICLGDAGYGLLMVIGATLYKFKANKKLKPILSFVQIIGLSTVVMGMVLGTFFGVNLIEANIPILDEVKKYMIDTDKLFTVSIAIGVVQVLFGMILKVVNAVKQYGWSAAISTIGWLVLIFGGGLIYLMKLYGIDSMIAGYSILSITKYFIFSIAGLLIFILNNPKRNIFINFGAGLWDSYNMITGLLGDLLSYIRLFALGVSSSVLGFVFNDIAFSLSGDTPVVSQIILVVILVLGHGINIFMSGLGSLVHPMRLTFVEFYKNAGFSGGGKKYAPFARVEK